MRIDDLRRAANLPGGSLARDAALSALRAYIITQPDAIIGCDFPFSLAQSFIFDSDWTTFVLSFHGRYSTPDDFYTQMRIASEKAKAVDFSVTRPTDRIAKTPFAPHNLRLYRQTWHGIADLIAPLVAADAARVLPMQLYQPSKPALIEICPASFLKRIGAYHPYKGKSPAHETQRRTILTRLQTEWSLDIEDADAKRICDDTEGDALDSVIAAVATWQSISSLQKPLSPAFDMIEGWIYVGA